MGLAENIVKDTFWTDKLRYDAAESSFQEYLAKQQDSGEKCGVAVQNPTTVPTSSSLVSEIAKAREQIKQSLSGGDILATDSEVVARINALSLENKELRKATDDLAALVKKLAERVSALETSKPSTAVASAPAPQAAVAKKAAKDDEDDDDDFDLFGSDEEEDEEAEKEKERIKAERIAAYNAKKSKKVAIIAKSSILLDVKPWSDETDLKAMEVEVRKIAKDGLVWGASKLVPMAYGIKKLQIVVIVEDDKVGVEELTEQIEEMEDFVQSVDIAAFNKI